jgi:hypothetical protein
MHKCNLHSWMMTLCCVGLFCNSSETFAGPHLESELAKHWPGVSIYNYGLQDSGEYRQISSQKWQTTPPQHIII